MLNHVTVIQGENGTHEHMEATHCRWHCPGKCDTATCSTYQSLLSRAAPPQLSPGEVFSMNDSSPSSPVSSNSFMSTCHAFINLPSTLLGSDRPSIAGGRLSGFIWTSK